MQSSILLISDLDETLIHATEVPLAGIPCYRYEQYYVYPRPYLHAFLTAVIEHFRIAIWSSAGDDYVAAIVEKVLPPDIPLEFCWGRSKCTMKRDITYDTFYFEKRLSKLKTKGYPMEKILIVDDTAEKARSNYGNAIYIKEFTGNPHDDELLHLLPYLLSLKTADNVRNIEKRNWRK